MEYLLTSWDIQVGVSMGFLDLLKLIVEIIGSDLKVAKNLVKHFFV